MTIIYCDLCGKSMERGSSEVAIRISEYRADACEECSRKLITYIKSGPWKAGAAKLDKVEVK